MFSTFGDEEFSVAERILMVRQKWDRIVAEQGALAVTEAQKVQGRLWQPILSSIQCPMDT